MPYQFQALTGIRRKPNYRAMIEAQTPYLSSLYAEKSQDKYRKQSQAQSELGFARETSLARERLAMESEQMAAQGAYNQEQLGLMQEQQEFGQQQSMIGQGIGTAQLGLSGYNAYNLFKKPPLPSTPPAGTYEMPAQNLMGAPGQNVSPLVGNVPHQAAIPSSLRTPTPQMTTGGLQPRPEFPMGSPEPIKAPFYQTPSPSPGAQSAMFAEGAGAGAGAYAGTGTTAMEAGITGSTPALSGAAINMPGATSGMATPVSGSAAAGTGSAGFGAAAKGISQASLGYPIGYYGSQMLGAPAKYAHGYGLAGTAGASAAMIAMGLAGPWSLLAIPMMMAMDPEGTKMLAKKGEKETKRFGGQVEKQVIRPGVKFIRDPGARAEKVWEETTRPVKKAVSEVKRVIKKCIIITACTDPYSYEVDIARQYRDLKMDNITLRGYYMLAEKLVPLIENSDKLKDFLKKNFVDRLVDVGEFELGLKTQKPKLLSRIITKGFLFGCHSLGLTKSQFIRCNGEVY